MFNPATLAALGVSGVSDYQVAAVYNVVSALAKGYTRGKGWNKDGEPAEDVAAVLTTATVRYITNAAGVQSESVGALSVNFGNNYLGWSLTELAVLNRYRERAT